MNWTGWFENPLSFLKMAAPPPPTPPPPSDSQATDDLTLCLLQILLDIILYPTARLSHNILLIFYFKTTNYKVLCCLLLDISNNLYLKGKGKIWNKSMQVFRRVFIVLLCKYESVINSCLWFLNIWCCLLCFQGGCNNLPCYLWIWQKQFTLC